MKKPNETNTVISMYNIVIIELFMINILVGIGCPAGFVQFGPRHVAPKMVLGDIKNDLMKNSNYLC